MSIIPIDSKVKCNVLYSKDHFNRSTISQYMDEYKEELSLHVTYY